MEDMTSAVDNNFYSAGRCYCTGGNNCYYHKSVAV